MTRSTKTMLALGMGIFIVCVCCGGFGVWGSWQVNRSIISDQDEIQMMGAEIASYTLPSGYSEIEGRRMLGSIMVIIAPDEYSFDDMQIILIKPPASANLTQPEIETQLSAFLNQKFVSELFTMSDEKVETRQLNGQMAELTYRSGTDANGTPYRQMSTLLESEKGQVLVLAQGTEAEWDQVALDSLLNSIR